MHRLIASCAALLLVFAACNRAEEPSSDTGATTPAETATTVTSPAGEASPPATAGVSDADRTFADTAARMGMAEVQLATNVSNRAQTQEVRSFAQRMITDHNRSNQELTALAAQKRIDPPADLDPKHKELDTRLASLTGPELDRAYMQAMVEDHATAVAAFESAAAQVTDPDLKAFAAKTLPVLHDHHRQAQEILGTLK
jgi:putative membrane protein